MTAFLLIFILIIFSGIKAAPAGGFFEDYLSKEKTNSIKGVFVILVMFCHASQYMNLGGSYDEAYMLLQKHLGQMIVAMFLFYSGYGMMESIQKKGFSYVKGIPCKRLLKVYANFFAALILFVIVDLCLGKLGNYDWKTILLSFTGWENIGNSNWYMFAVFALYILTFLAFYLTRWSRSRGALFAGAFLLTVFAAVFVYWQIWAGKPGYFYNTVLLFPFGCWYSLCKPWIEKKMMKNELCYMLVCAVTIVLYAFVYKIRGDYGIGVYTAWAVVFTLTIVWFTMKISVSNPVLDWFGSHVFSVYILQRIPMIIFAYFGLGHSHRYFFFVMSIASTIFLSHVFDTVMAYCTNIVWEKRENG